MKENIETKDVQRTEYLDKNGLDMLWAKVKENTHNQVEVEYNRAKAKEDSLSQEIASVKPAEGKVFLQVEDEYPTKVLKDGNLRFDDSSTQVFSLASGDGFFVYDNSDESGAKTVSVSSTGIESDPNRKSDTKVWNTNGGITDLASYALNSDVTEKIAAKADTTALTALEEKVTANTTAIEGKQDAGNYIPYELYNSEAYGEFYKIPESIVFQSNGSSNRKETRIGSSYMQIGSSSDESLTAIYSNNITVGTKNSGNLYLGKDYIRSFFNRTDKGFELNKNGIALYGGSKNHVLTSNASTIDITQYALKSELPTAATKEELGVVKVGDGLNVADGVISVAPDYIIDMMSYGVEWDTTVADPTCTRIGNPLYHKQLPIQSQYKGCLVKDGAVNYYLDPNDWSKNADGTPSVLDGTDGDVMVHIPKFYGKSGSNGNKRWVRIATTKIDPSWVEIPEMFVSAYRVTVNEGSAAPKAASVVNTSSSYRGGNNREGYDQYLSTDKFRTDLGKPRTNISRAAMRTNANNSGQELLCYEFYKWVFYWAYVIEYANFNSQKEFNSELTSDGYHQGGLGKGITTINSSRWNNYNNYYPLTPCGYTNEFGNFSGVKQMIIPAVETDNGITVGSDTTMYANRWRGFENPFGDIWTNLDGIVLKRDSANAESKVYTTTDSSKFGGGPSVMNVAGIEVAADGYIKEFDLGETGEIIPQLVGGSESTYKCDYHWCNASSTDTRTLLVGGCADYGGMAGLGCFRSNTAVSYAASHVGFRSVVRA